MVSAPTLIQQLHGKVDELRRMSDQLRNGEFLRPVVNQARDETVWVRGPQIAFTGWIEALDAWMRNQLVGALDAVRQRIEAYVRDFDNAQQAFANGIPGVALPPPPAPVGVTAPTCPYQFRMEIPKGTNPSMNPDLMRKGLGNTLGRAKEEIHAFSQKLGDVLTEPAPAPGAPAVPGAPPMRHLPPDAKEAAGVPGTYQFIEMQLDQALLDVLDRAQTWEEAQAADDSPSLGGGLLGMPFEKVRDLFADLEQRAHAEAEQVSVPETTPEASAPEPLPGTQQEKPPPTPEQVEEARKEGARLAEEALENDALKNPDELKKTAEALAAHKDDPASEPFAAAFVEKFGAANMVAVSRKLHTWQTGMPKPKPGEWMQFEEEVPRPKDEDVQSILYAFSATLATATQYDDFNHDVENDILTTDDDLAFSQLLANPDADFDPDFLVKAFERGVKYTLLKEANLTGIGGYGRAEVPLRLLGHTLERDTKLVVLGAISRNPVAAMRIADIEYKPPLTIPMGMRPAVKVNNVVELLYNGGNTTTGYGDKGAALGRFLDAAHKGFYDSGDFGNAKDLVDRILNGATNDKEVAKAQEYLRLIGLRQPVSEDDVNQALAQVREDPKHPGREALLAMASKSREAALKFAESATEAASKSKVNPDKVMELKSLYETDAGWDHIATVQAHDDPKVRNVGETVTEQSVIAVAGDQKLTDAARRGMAKAITANVAGFATSAFLYKQAPGDPRPSHMDPSAVGIHVSANELRDAMADLMKDPEARRTLEMGAGNLTASWGATVATQELDKLLGRSHPDEEQLIAGRQADELGNYLCTMVAAVGTSAEDKAQAAVDALAGMRLGVDLMFMGVDFAKGFVPGGNVLFTKSAKWLFDKGMEKLEGGLDVEGMSEGLKGGAKYYLQDDVRTKEEAEWAKAKADVEGTHVLVDNLVRDTLTCNLLSQALTRPPGERDQLLDALHIRATADDGTELRGLLALQDAGLLDKHGQFGIPPAGTAEYTRYLDWTGHEAKAFAEKVDNMGKDTARHFTDCMVTHLDIKGTGPK